jgi:hypothetical protein
VPGANPSKITRQLLARCYSDDNSL